MNYQDFDSYIKNRVYKISYTKQLDLALAICKKLFLEYEIFYDTHKFGDPDLLKKALQLIDQSKLKSINQNEIRELLSEIELITPDTDDYGDWVGSYGLNACNSISATLEFLMDRDS